MLKAVKAIVDTAGHYSRPDVVRLLVNDQAPGREPVLRSQSFFEGLSPRALVDAADAHGVEPSRVETLLQSALAKPALIADKTS
jgi:hypothetical protein